MTRFSLGGMDSMITCSGLSVWPADWLGEGGNQVPCAT